MFTLDMGDTSTYSLNNHLQTPKLSIKIKIKTIINSDIHFKAFKTKYLSIILLNFIILCGVFNINTHTSDVCYRVAKS